MSAIAEIERDLLGLPTADRERLVLKAWESLVRDPDAASNPEIDSEAINLAIERDSEIESGKTTGISHEEFIRRTSGD
jgi:putative addiction module component